MECKYDEQFAIVFEPIQQGALYPELLFSDDPEESKRVTLHPAILWKLLNVRANLARGKT
jgi:hypothetical protein